MEKQKTFEGNFVFSVAIEWITNLSKCFEIKKVVITKQKQRYDWRGDKVRVVVRYD